MPAQEVKTLHPFVKKAYEAATFNCPQKCGKSDLSLEKLMEHVNEKCEFRLVKCPNQSCGEVLNRFFFNKHRANCRANQNRCHRCDGEKPAAADHCCITTLHQKIKNDYISKFEWLKSQASLKQTIS